MLLPRAFAQELVRSSPRLSDVPRPHSTDARVLATAAGLLQLIAHRIGQAAPAWTMEIGPLPEPFYLVQAAARMKRLRLLCETESPEPLRKRRLLAPPSFLEFA